MNVLSLRSYLQYTNLTGNLFSYNIHEIEISRSFYIIRENKSAQNICEIKPARNTIFLFFDVMEL